MSHQPVEILLVEDNEDDLFFMRRALHSADITNPLQVLTTGTEAWPESRSR